MSNPPISLPLLLLLLVLLRAATAEFPFNETPVESNVDQIEPSVTCGFSVYHKKCEYIVSSLGRGLLETTTAVFVLRLHMEAVRLNALIAASKADSFSQEFAFASPEAKQLKTCKTQYEGVVQRVDEAAKAFGPSVSGNQSEVVATLSATARHYRRCKAAFKDPDMGPELARFGGANKIFVDNALALYRAYWQIEWLERPLYDKELDAEFDGEFSSAPPPPPA